MTVAMHKWMLGRRLYLINPSKPLVIKSQGVGGISLAPPGA
jgi:hypothetical protein